MAWCCQAISPYLSLYWPISLSPYGITRPQWVNYEVSFVSFISDLFCIYMRPTNERRYNVTSSLIGWAHTQNDFWINDQPWICTTSHVVIVLDPCNGIPQNSIYICYIVIEWKFDLSSANLFNINRQICRILLYHQWRYTTQGNWKSYGLLYPRPTKLEGGILDSPCPSVCPSVRLSVDDMVSGA